MDEVTIEQLLGFAEETAREAGKLILERSSDGFKISKKGRVNLVTEVDLASEDLIVQKIKSQYPDHQILAEERGAAEGFAEIKWVIDPIDGTTNYAHGYPFYCVSIGVEAEGQIVAGAVHDPVRKETFTAAKGMGAFLNGHKIKVSDERFLEESLLVTGFSYEADQIRRNLDLFNEVMMTVRSVRRDGSAALDFCYVACGRYEGFWELSLHSWDVAAGILMVEEAGGRVTRFDLSCSTIYDRECLATNGKIHEDLSELLLRVDTER